MSRFCEGLYEFAMSKVMLMDSPPQPGDYFTVHPNVGNKDYCSGQG